MAYTKQTWADSPATTSPLSAARLNVIEDGIFNVGGGWAAHTPTWTGLTIGDATVSTRYQQFGKTVVYMGQVTFGAGSSYSGVFFPSLPVSPAGVSAVGSAWAFDTSATAWYTGVFVPGNYFLFGTVGRAAPTVPITWATGDILTWNLTYEAA